jgi:hypothetical protein
MASAKTNPVAAALAQALEPEGLRRKAGNWYLRAEDVIWVVNLQKSRYGNQYYVNFALWINALGTADLPKVNLCPIGWRLGAFRTRKEKLLSSLLDIDQRMPGAERIRALVEFIRADSLPVLKKCDSLDGIRQAIKTGSLPEYYLHVAAKRLLGIVVE